MQMNALKRAAETLLRIAKFTVKEEKDAPVASLDTMTTRNPDGTIKNQCLQESHTH